MPPEPTHDWRSCPGLAEHKARIEALGTFFSKQEEWIGGRFASFRAALDTELRAITGFIEDVRLAALGSTHDAEARTGEAFKRGTSKFDALEQRLRDVEADRAEYKTLHGQMTDVSESVSSLGSRFDRFRWHVYAQWVVILLLSVTSIGLGAVKLWPFLAALIHRVPP